MSSFSVRSLSLLLCVAALSVRAQSVSPAPVAVPVSTPLSNASASGPGEVLNLDKFVVSSGLDDKTAFDLAQERLGGFSAFRFLYERLLGADIRPFLPAAFCGAAALPQIRPERRKLLLQSLSEAAATAPGWSSRPPCFYPEYVEAEAA